MKSISPILPWILTAAIIPLNPSVAYANEPPNPSDIQVSEGAKTQTVEDLKKKYPNAKIKQVTPDEFEKEKKKYNSTFNCGDELEDPANNTNGDYNVIWTDAFDGIRYRGGGSSSSNNGKELLIIVVVIGVVVVAALLIYTAAYLSRMAFWGYDCRVWTSAGLRHSRITDSTITQKRDGEMTGIYYSMGYRTPFGVTGLTLESGYLDLDLSLRETNDVKKYTGLYILAGPSFLIPFNEYRGHAFTLELLGGTSTANDIGFMSTMRAGFKFKITDTFNLGFQAGAALVDVNNLDGYLSSSDNLNFLSGVTTTYRW